MQPSIVLAFNVIWPDTEKIVGRGLSDVTLAQLNLSLEPKDYLICTTEVGYLGVMFSRKITELFVDFANPLQSHVPIIWLNSSYIQCSLE